VSVTKWSKCYYFCWSGYSACALLADLHVPFLTIHHHYVIYSHCPYVMNVVLLMCQESKTKVFVTFQRKKGGGTPSPGPTCTPNCNTKPQPPGCETAADDHSALHLL